MSVVGIDPGQKGYQCVLPFPRVARDPFFSLPPHESDGRISRTRCLRLCRDWFNGGVRLVVIENQQPMSKGGIKQGSVSIWSLATTFATWTTALEAAGFREADGIDDVREVEEETTLGDGALPEWSSVKSGEMVSRRPVFLCVAGPTWKAHMGCMGAGGDRKRALELIVLAARAGFPGVELRAVERAKDLKRHKDSADRAAALLLSEFGRRLLERAAK